MLKLTRKQNHLVELIFAALIAGCSSSDSMESSASDDNQDSPMSESDDNQDSSMSESDPSANQTTPFDLFPDSMIDPLLADIQPGSPLSVENYPTFLSAYFRLAGSQLMQNITRPMDAASIEIRAAIAGEASQFMAESVAGMETDNTLQATLACPDGGRVSVSLGTEPLSNVELFTQDIYGNYRDELIYDNCSFNGITTNGATTEQNSNLLLTGRTTSRRFGGFVYSGGSTGANQFTEHPEGFGDTAEQFTVSDASGVSAVLFAQQSYIFLSADPEPLHRWHGNWRLQDDDRSMAMTRMNIALAKGGNGGDTIPTSVTPHFTVTGNVTNGRTITNLSQESVVGIEENQSLVAGAQSISDLEGGILDLTVESAEEDNVASSIVLRLDTDGQILNEALPVSDEALLLINIL